MDRLKTFLPAKPILFIYFICITGFGFRLAYLPFVLIGILDIIFIGDDLTYLFSSDYGGALLFYLILILLAPIQLKKSCPN